MLLRDDKLVALDCAIVAAKKAADAYEDAAVLAQDKDTEALFRRLSERRDAMAAELEQHVLALGDLPSDPDVESEVVGNVWRHLKAALSADERPQLLAEAAELEDQLSTCFETAAAADLSEAAIVQLRTFRDEVVADRARLAEMSTS